MPNSHYQLLSSCSDEQLQVICQRRKVPQPQRLADAVEWRNRLLKTMIFHLEDNRQLTNTLADLDTSHLRALKALAEDGVLPGPEVLQDLFGLGLTLPQGDEWVVLERTADALADFDLGALDFQGDPGTALLAPLPYGFAMALTSVLLRCTGGIRVLKGGLPAKKELVQLLNRNAFIRDERDGTLLFALLHRLGLLWSREGRVDTLLPAVLSQSPRWVVERAFAKLVEDDLKLWNFPPAEDRRFLMEHLLERRGQVLCIQPFLAFLETLHPLDRARTEGVLLPFLTRMGLVAVDEAGTSLRLTEHGEALAQEYLFRDHRGTEEHWKPVLGEQPLVVQPTHEALTPMMQNPHRLLRLAQLAEVESLDTLVQFRLATDTLVRALDAHVTMAEIRERLKGAGTQLPQTVDRLLDDLEARLGEVEVLQGMRIVRARTPELAAELRMRPELASLKLEPLSDTLLEVKGPGNAFALLKQVGFLPAPGRFLPVSLDGDESLYLWSLACLAFVDQKGMNHHLDPVRQIIHNAIQRIQSEDPNLHQEIMRRVPMLNLGGGPQQAEETQRILEYAAGYNLMVDLTYLPLAAHRSQLRRVTPRAVEGEHLVGFCHLHQEEMTFRLSRITGVRLLSERGWVPPAH